MSLVDAGFKDKENRADAAMLARYGPTLAVTVGHLKSDNTLDADGPAESVYALVDTGAEQSCIDDALAQKLNLPVVNIMTIAGAGGAKDCPVYLAGIDIPALDFYQYGQFAGVDLAAGGQEHRVLLGRTFLSSVIMIYDGVRAQITLAK